jgi:hypothetical protein
MAIYRSGNAPYFGYNFGEAVTRRIRGSEAERMGIADLRCDRWHQMTTITALALCIPVLRERRS